MDKTSVILVVVLLWITIASAILDLKATDRYRPLWIGATLAATFFWLALFAAALTLEFTCASAVRASSAVGPPPSELINNVLLTDVAPPKDKKCLICHDDIVHCVAIKACGHKFCDLCIRQYFTKWSYCPRDMKPLFDKRAINGERDGVKVDVYWSGEIVWACVTALSLAATFSGKLHDESLAGTVAAVAQIACWKMWTAAELSAFVHTVAKAVRPTLVDPGCLRLQSRLCSIDIVLSLAIGLLGQTSALRYLRLMALVCFRMPRLIGFVTLWEHGLVRS